MTPPPSSPRGEPDAETGDGLTHRSRDRTARLRVLVFALVVFIASIVPIPGSSGGATMLPLGLGLTDPFHLIGYGILAWLFVDLTGSDGRGVVLAAALSTGFGFGIELAQAVVPWRTFAWDDVLLNALGASAGAAVRWLRRGSR